MSIRLIAATLLLLAAEARAQSADVTTAELQQTEFVFVGRVTKTEGVVFPELSAEVRLAEVTVEEVIAKPESSVVRPQDRVFVAFGDPFPELNARLRVFGAALSYGTAIAMREVARQEAPPSTMSAEDVTEERTEVREDLNEAKLEQALDASVAAIVGKVVSIQDLPWQNRVTEHDPLWTDAVVEVTSWIKGGAAQRVVVQFPASYDVDWFDVPKLKPGMEWTFFLHEGALPSATSEAADLTRFRIVSPQDVHPVSEAETVRKINAGNTP